jgi:Mg2+-importing ATPase
VNASNAIGYGNTLGADAVVLIEKRRSHFMPIRVAPALVQAASGDVDLVLRNLQTSKQGLSEDEAAHRLRTDGPNSVAQEAHYRKLILLGKAIVNPLVILLMVLATLSYLTDDSPRAAIVMLAMVVLGVTLRFVQEARADNAAEKLKAMIRVTATVIRNGQERDIPLADLVRGDLIRLAAGDMIPGDVRLLSCKDLFVTQSSLTGEAFPVEKFETPEPGKELSPLELRNICFLGTSVESGTAQGVVVTTGRNTYLGSMASSIVDQSTQTSFDRGISQFTWLMLRFMLVMVPAVFVINGVMKHDWRDAFFFAMAVAVGLTPEMLPMIVTVCLSKGAIAMSRKAVIVKQLNSIQNLGAMDILCTDKTGTLTMDHIILERHCDVVLETDNVVLELAYLNSHFQTGLKNLLDRAILKHESELKDVPFEKFTKVDEIPFDFVRKIMSVVVKTPEGQNRLVCKGAPEEVFNRCATFEMDGKFLPMNHLLIADLREEYERLSSDGFRVLAVAYKDLDAKPAYSKDDEKALTLRGYLAFLDPPKDTARAAIAGLHEHGVSVRVLTGDNELVTQKICSEVGIDSEKMLLGRQIEPMSEAQLAEAVEHTTVFARLSPAHKQRIIKAYQSNGHTVGFMGDGINDAPALRAADVGISVDTAVDIAKESANIILLQKSLLVLEEGVLEGRKIFANILKYIRMGASSNFGNMFSVLGASIFLPYLPMLPIQILTNNLLYDFSQVPIPTDDVDPEQIAKPRPWAISQIARFILFIGPCSSIFDYTTFFMMLYLFSCWTAPFDPVLGAAGGFVMQADVQMENLRREHLFQTGWFVESLLTQTLIIHIIRTNRMPFLQSRASWQLTLTTLLVMAVGIWLSFPPQGSFLYFVELPTLYWPLLGLTLVLYVMLTQGVKSWLMRRGWL